MRDLKTEVEVRGGRNIGRGGVGGRGRDRQPGRDREEGRGWGGGGGAGGRRGEKERRKREGSRERELACRTAIFSSIHPNLLPSFSVLVLCLLFFFFFLLSLSPLVRCTCLKGHCN